MEDVGAESGATAVGTSAESNISETVNSTENSTRCWLASSNEKSKLSKCPTEAHWS